MVLKNILFMVKTIILNTIKNYSKTLVSESTLINMFIKKFIYTLSRKILWKNQKNNREKKIHFDHMKSYDFNKYGKYFTMIYNDAWKSHHGFKEMKTDKAVKMFKKMKSIIDKKLIWFGFYEKTPVCFFIGIPDPNSINKFINGRFKLIRKN